MFQSSETRQTWKILTTALFVALTAGPASAQRLIPTSVPNQATVQMSRQELLAAAHQNKDSLRLKRDLMGEKRDRWGSVTREMVKEARSHLRLMERENILTRNWLETETKSFMRMTGVTLDDLKDSFDDRKNLIASSKGAARFSNGSGSRRNRSDFVDLSWKMSQTPSGRAALAKPVASMPAKNFGAHRFGGIVLANADLRQLPESLRRGMGERIHHQFNRQWQTTVSDLRDGQSIPTERIDRMLNLVDDLRAESARTASVQTPAAKSYLRNCEELVYALVNPENRAALTRYIEDSGHAFPGGATNDLLRHVLNHQLTIHTGSDAHLALGQYTHAIIAGANNKAEELDRRIERLKQQLPGNNAVMRERMVPVEFGASTDRRYISAKAPWDLESKDKKE